MIIKTLNQSYFYDNIGLVVPNANVISAILNIENWHTIDKEIIIDCLKNKFPISKISFYYKWLLKIKKFKEDNVYDEFISCNNIQMLNEYLLKFGFKQLILSVTEDCNFRCSYCTYSSDYHSFRDHSYNYMTFDIAKKAIDVYFDYVVNGEKYNLFRQPTVGFYGGEPLLNYDLIKKSVNYIKKIYNEEVIFTISTNGSLLNKSIMNFLMDNNFSITISFDGNFYEQNRNRKFKNYKNSFDIVFKNLMYLIDSNYDSIYVHPVFDFKTNLKECDSFFSKNNIKVISISDVDNVFTKKYYNKFTQEDYELFNKNLLKLRENYLPNSFYSYFYHLFEAPCVDFFLNSKMCSNLHMFNKFSDSCIPGEKLFVDSNGIFHMCERVPETKPIGDVESGINFNMILKIIDEFNKQLICCFDCEISNICNKCYRDFIEKNKFASTKKVCYLEIEEKQKELKELIEFMEINQIAFEKRNIYYNNLFNWRK